MNIETRHLAPYLPYNLMCKVKDEGKIVVAEMHSIYADGTCTFCNTVESEKGFDWIVPILRPLKDIDIPIEIQGQKIIPLEYISTSKADSQQTMKRIENKQSLDVLEFWKYERLFQLHFDVFNLISEGIAEPFESQGVSDK